MRKIISILFFLFLTPVVFASELTDLLNSVHTMRANFVQAVYDNHGKRIQESSGRMAMQRPGKFRWQVIAPMPQLIIANESRLWIYDPDLEQVTIRTLDKAAGETPALLLSHVNSDLEKEFTIQALDHNLQGLRWFELRPKKSDNMFQSIQMGFQHNEIQQMNLEDSLGHKTVIQFKKIETNKNLAESLFKFSASSKIDVIDETHR